MDEVATKLVEHSAVAAILGFVIWRGFNILSNRILPALGESSRAVGAANECIDHAMKTMSDNNSISIQCIADCRETIARNTAVMDEHLTYIRKMNGGGKH